MIMPLILQDKLWSMNCTLTSQKRKMILVIQKKKDAIEKYETAILLLSNLKEVANEMQDKLALSNFISIFEKKN